MKDLTIGIIGGGVVGRAVARTYLDFVKEVRVWDMIKERTTTSHIGECVFLADLVFICLPEGEVNQCLRHLDASGYADRNYVLKSTVPIGTTKRLAQQYGFPNIVHSPEFLTERVAMTDALLPARNIIGNIVPPTNVWSAGNRAAEHLNILHHTRFPGIQVQLMSSDESEAVKLMTNAFFATKISFMNEMRGLCDGLGLNWEAVLAGMLSDGRISHSHTQVPGHDGLGGFGGRCLPKDLEQLIQCYSSPSVETLPVVLEAVQQYAR